MLDIKRIRENLEDIKKAMDRRGEKEFDLDAVVALSHGHLCVQYSLIDNYRIKGSTACHQQNAGLQGFLSGRI